MTTREAAMEKNVEICLCHGQEWTSEVEMLEHQVRHHRQLTEQGKEELELFRTALGEVADKNTQQKMKEEKAMLEEKRAAFEEERKQIENLLRLESSHVYERMIALAAWEARLGHREVEAREMETTHTYLHLEE